MNEETKTRGEILEEIKSLNLNMLRLSAGIKTNTFTRKQIGAEPYPLRAGYALGVRRPMRDLLKWVENVEETLYLIVDLLERDPEG